MLFVTLPPLPLTAAILMVLSTRAMTDIIFDARLRREARRAAARGMPRRCGAARRVERRLLSVAIRCFSAHGFRFA